jgi:hypothetical protein
MKRQELKKSGADAEAERRRTLAVDCAGSEAAVVVVGLGQDADPTGGS